MMNSSEFQLNKIIDMLISKESPITLMVLVSVLVL